MNLFFLPSEAPGLWKGAGAFPNRRKMQEGFVKNEILFIWHLTTNWKKHIIEKYKIAF